MTTKYEDALSILGVEHKSIVDEIEKKSQSQSVTRSDINDLITRSIDEAVNKSNTEGVQSLDDLDKPELLKLLKKMTEEGDITEDALTENLNEMLNATTDRSENTPKMEENTETPVEKNGDEMEYKPFGGAITLGEANKFLNSIRQEDAIWRLYSTFGAVSQNIMNNSELSAEQKASSLQSLVQEFKNSLTPQGLEQYKSTAEVVSRSDFDTVNSKLDELKAIIGELSKQEHTANVNVPVQPEVVEESQAAVISNKIKGLIENAVSKSGDERKYLLQSAIEETAREMSVLLEAETPTQTDDVATKSMVEDVVNRAVAFQVGELKQEITELSAALKGILSNANRQPVVTPAAPPVSRAITNAPQVNKTQNKPLTIREIATRSVRGY